jgi:hypothetical protein
MNQRRRTCTCPSAIQQAEISAILPTSVVTGATAEEEEEIQDADVNDAQTIALKLRFIVLQGDTDVATDTNILDNVQYLNETMNATNFSELSMIPLNFQQTVGNANMIFVVAAIVKVANVTESFSSLHGVVSAHGGQATGGNINVFVCDLEEPLLGEAFLGGNVLCMDKTTVGSPLRPNFYGNASVNRGKTLVHELGHCLGLLHTFNNGSSCVPVFEDIPAQMEPNGAAYLAYQASTNTFVPWLDNRRRDCEVPTLNKEGSDPPYSCLARLGLPCAQGFVSEAFFNFLDYTSDFFLVTFSNDQCDSMRKLVKQNMGIFGATMDTLLPNIKSITAIEATKSKTGPEWLVPVIATILVFVFLVSFAVIATYNSFSNADAGS